MTQTLECSVLFADLRGSTGLYETLGNALATQWVTRTVAVLTEVVLACDGRVVKTLGDGLMAIFTSRSSAVQASIQMHDVLARRGADEWIGAAQANRVQRLQVGLAHGEVVELGGDFFGDAVNVAARLLEHSGDNETLATSAVLDGLSDIDRAQFRRLERLQLRGRAEPVEVHVLETRQTVDMVATTFGDVLAAPEPEGVRLTWLDSSRVFGTSSMPVVLGRSPQATYCIDDNRVSRSHARIDWHGGAFQLTDLSYNGSYVRYGADREAVSLRRGSCTLHGRGVIGLGTSPLDAKAPCVHFEVLRFTDTQPQPAPDL
jgi:class 3 adenylate cyclase